MPQTTTQKSVARLYRDVERLITEDPERYLLDTFPLIPLDGPAPRRFYSALQRQVQDIGYDFRRTTNPGGFGCTDHTMRRIEVKRGLPPHQTLDTTVHELTHAMLPTDPWPWMLRRIGEIRAESVAFVVCDVLGLPSDSFSLGYIAHWADADMGFIHECVRYTVSKTANQILAGI